MFEGWDDFYLLIGSAGGALVGLLFVVVTLTTGTGEEKTLRGQILYMSPVVFHFGVVLATSAMAMAPGLSIPAEAVLAGLFGLAGLAIGVRVTVGLALGAKQPDPPHWSDVWFYGVGPSVVYLAMLAAAAAIFARLEAATYAVAGTVSVLLMLGIRNAWDLVTYLAPRAEK